jgi:RNA polymerase sigma-70 factor (ECF subfamily)
VEFQEVYDRFRAPVWRLARRLTRDEQEALDASQEIFLRVWKGLPTFRGDARLSTWVFQIAWNYLRAYRRRKGRHMQLISETSRSPRQHQPEPIAPGGDPERAAASREMLAKVDGALRRLPEHQRVVIWLRDGEDLSYHEIARVLDVPIGTVRSRLARARDALRRIVET